VPFYGEYLDLTVVFGSDYAWWQRGLAGVSLVSSVFSGGFGTNYGAIARGRRAIADDNPSLATWFSGSRRNQLSQPEGVVRNADGVLFGREFSGHAFDQMQNRGIMPSVVEQALVSGRSHPSSVLAGRTIHHDPVNNVSVVTRAGGAVVTVGYGRFR